MSLIASACCWSPPHIAARLCMPLLVSICMSLVAFAYRYSLPHVLINTYSNSIYYIRQVEYPKDVGY